MLPCVLKQPNPLNFWLRKNAHKNRAAPSAGVVLFRSHILAGTGAVEGEVPARRLDGRRPVKASAPGAWLNPKFHRRLPVLRADMAVS
ncbi:hypothetical protein B0G69_3610 [Paraburkholderia sp. RAU2J]|nr:hypothetical protein B0G69_3610 [Paraburkholderia sp. RAU2J]